MPWPPIKGWHELCYVVKLRCPKREGVEAAIEGLLLHEGQHKLHPPAAQKMYDNLGDWEGPFARDVREALIRFGATPK